MNPNYQVNWHHKAICDRLTRLVHERGQKVMIFVGPQRGKSEIVSRNFPAWWLGQFPASKNILSSYSGDLANSFNRDCQNIMAEEDYAVVFPDTITGAREPGLKSTQNEMHTSERGYLFSVGVGGSTTGRAAGEIGTGKDDARVSPGVFIVDDPVKDMKEAFSANSRESKMDWWRSVVNTRVHRTSHMILMHTRWHQSDVAGTLLQEGALEKGWEILSFPEVGPDPYHPNEYDPRTDEHETIWPDEKGDYDEIMKIKEAVGSYTFSALYQQSPKVQGGDIIKEEWINLYTSLPFDPHQKKACQLLQSWDLQFKETGTSFTCGVTLAKHGGDIYLIDIYHKKADVIMSQNAIITMNDRYKWNNTVLVEDKANGPAIISLLKKKVSGMIPVKPEASKDERLHAVAPIFESGNFYIPANHPKTKTIIEELTTFPASSHDDIVDAISQGIQRLGTLKGLSHLRASVS